MSTSRKDYRALAQALADSCPKTNCFTPFERETASYAQWHADVEAITNVLASNPNFNRAKFLDYIEVHRQE